MAAAITITTLIQTEISVVNSRSPKNRYENQANSGGRKTVKTNNYT